MGSKASQVLISLGLGELPFSPLTLREAIVSGFSIIGKSVSGGWLADQSPGPFYFNYWLFVLFLAFLMLGVGGAVDLHPRREEWGEERRDVKLDELFLPCHLGRGLDVR